MPSLADAIPLLKEAGQQATADVERVAKHISLPGGQALFLAADPANALHFLLAGALAVVRTGTHGDELIGYIRAGDPVGEMALIAGGKHTASVYAVRDSELIRISREDYEQLWHQYPVLIQSLARRMLERARSPKPDLHAAPPKAFGLIGLSPAIDLAKLAHDLRRRVTALGLKCIVLSEAGGVKPASYFETVEQENDILLFETQFQDTPWYRLVLRQADRLWLFTRRDGAQPPPPLQLDVQSATKRFRLVDLIYLHSGDTNAAKPKAWVDAVGATRLFHWKTDQDAARLARVLAGKSVGIVFSGGGARAYAHVGAVRALREARIPIDFVGGTSMGAIVAAGVALGWPDDELAARIRDAFVLSNPLGDHHLPVVALTRGKIVEERLVKHFGDACIEDLALPYFCVSTDLVSGTQRIHRDGRVRDALRASIALPGVLPPVADGHSVLVDGAVLNNLPTDIMQTLHSGPTLGVDVAQQGSIDPKDFLNPPDFLRWIMTHGLKDPPPIVSLLMRTATLSIDPAANRKAADLLIVPNLNSVEIRDWKAFDVAVAAGYEATVQALQSKDAETLPRLS